MEHDDSEILGAPSFNFGFPLVDQGRRTYDQRGVRVYALCILCAGLGRCSRGYGGLKRCRVGLERYRRGYGIIGVVSEV